MWNQSLLQYLEPVRGPGGAELLPNAGGFELLLDYLIEGPLLPGPFAPGEGPVG